MAAVTDIKLADALHLCFAHSTDAIVITDAKGLIIDVNASFTRMFGYTREEALGKTNGIIRSSVTTNNFYQAMWADILDPHKNYWKGEIFNRRKDGVEMPVLLTISTYYYKDQLAGYMGISVDIAPQRILQDKLLQHEKMVSLGLMVAGVAHEIGNPLTSISSIVQALQRKVTESKVLEKLAQIREHIDRITHVVRDLMENTHASHYQAMSVNLHDVLLKAIDLARFHQHVRYFINVRLN